MVGRDVRLPVLVERSGRWWATDVAGVKVVREERWLCSNPGNGAELCEGLSF